MSAHRLSIEDRGLQHVHRWAPSCACGWRGVFRRRRREAEKQYRQHVDGLEAAVRTARRGERARPVAPTPAPDLPEVLR